MISGLLLQISSINSTWINRISRSSDLSVGPEVWVPLDVVVMFFVSEDSHFV